MRQDASAVRMIWDILKLASHVSQMTLELSHLIMISMPPRVATGQKVERGSRFLKPSDVMVSEIEGICTVRNNVEDAPEGAPWDRDQSRETWTK